MSATLEAEKRIPFNEVEIGQKFFFSPIGYVRKECVKVSEHEYKNEFGVCEFGAYLNWTVYIKELEL